MLEKEKIFKKARTYSIDMHLSPSPRREKEVSIDVPPPMTDVVFKF